MNVAKVAETLVKSGEKVVIGFGKGKVKPSILVDGEFVNYKAGKKIVDLKFNSFELQVKPDISIPFAPATINQTKPAMRISKNFKTGEINSAAQAELGNVSVRLAEHYSNVASSAKVEIGNIFKGQKLSVRSKGANSIYSKLEKKVLEKGKVIRTDAAASKLIGDAIGGRVLMKDLTAKDIVETLKTLKIQGKALTAQEQTIMQKFFANKALTEEELKVAQKYSRTVKLALAEKQSAPVVNQILVSSLKSALDRGVTTMAQIEKSGVSKDVINQLKTGKNITPLRMTELNNYTGKDGIPYFTDSQIAQLKELQIATGESFDIITRPEVARFKDSLLPLESKAIKESGYTTAQFNAVLSDGTLAEIQIRGKGPFGEVEHIAYDSRQGKNTLSHVYDDYKAAVSGLEDSEYKEYNEYLSSCYDYYRDIELGIKSTKPKLPAKFNKILSEESMINLHAIDNAEQEAKKATFKQHLRLTA